MLGINKRFFLERPRPLPSQQQQEQKFHEIDRNDYQDYMKRVLNDDRVVKRNFDEIDRFGLNHFVQSSPSRVSLLNKRNFDEIDRFANDLFTDAKRVGMMDNGNEMERNNKYMKFV